MPRLFIVAGWLAALAPDAAIAKDVQYDIRVDGLTCPFCAATSERALERIDGVRSVSTDLRDGLITVCADESVALTEEQLSRLFLRHGFTYRSHDRRETCAADAAPAAEGAGQSGDR